MMHNHLPRRPLIISLILAAIVAIASIVVANYLGVFRSDPLANGPVTVRPEASAKPVKTVPYRLESAITGLNVPWSLVFTSPERWLVSERSGSIRVVEAGQLRAEPLVTFDSVSHRAEEGLMGLALDPDYSTNHLVYACYATPRGSGIVDRVVRFEDRGSSAGARTTVIDNIPAAQFHAGCRLGFGPDRKLYITTGDASNRPLAQRKDSLAGKILRLNPDGSVPSDNPFPGSPIWSLGHRNPQGLAWQPGTGQLFATEHGPSGADGPLGGDEVNRIQRAANYGWPTVSHEATDARFISPLLVFTPAVAPSGAAFYNGDTFPQFKDNLFFTGLKGEGLFRVIFSQQEPGQVASYEKLPDVNVGRLRDVVVAPNGEMYLLTSNRDGRGSVRSGDDHIYRLVPAAQ